MGGRGSSSTLKNNSVTDVLSHNFGEVPLSTKPNEFLSFGEKNIKNVYNEIARQYAGLTRDKYNEQYRKYQSIKNKSGIMSPKDVEDSMKITKQMIENEQYNLKSATNKTTKSSTASTIVGMAKSYNMLNDWFDTKKTNPKYFNQQWKNYYKKHPEKFR